MSNLTGLLCANEIQPRKNTVTCVAVVAAVKAHNQNNMQSHCIVAM